METLRSGVAVGSVYRGRRLSGIPVVSHTMRQTYAENTGVVRHQMAFVL